MLQRHCPLDLVGAAGDSGLARARSEFTADRSPVPEAVSLIMPVWRWFFFAWLTWTCIANHVLLSVTVEPFSCNQCFLFFFFLNPGQFNFFFFNLGVWYRGLDLGSLI